MKNVIIVSTSIRNGSNSEILAHEFEKGAIEAGNTVDFLTLKGKRLEFCRGCLACQKTGRCVIRDDMDDMIERFRKADVICFATPVYYYEMSGQLKTLLDRLNPLFGTDHRFKEIYLIATCYDENRAALDRAINGLGGWIECFDGVSLKGVIYGNGLNNPNQAKASESILKETYNIGKNI